MGVKYHFRRDTRVAASDDHYFRALAGGCQLFKTAKLDRQASRDKRPISLDQPLGESHARVRFHLLGPAAHVRLSLRSGPPARCYARRASSPFCSEVEEFFAQRV